MHAVCCRSNALTSSFPLLEHICSGRTSTHAADYWRHGVFLRCAGDPRSDLPLRAAAHPTSVPAHVRLPQPQVMGWADCEGRTRTPPCCTLSHRLLSSPTGQSRLELACPRAPHRILCAFALRCALKWARMIRLDGFFSRCLMRRYSSPPPCFNDDGAAWRDAHLLFFAFRLQVGAGAILLKEGASAWPWGRMRARVCQKSCSMTFLEVGRSSLHCQM